MLRTARLAGYQAAEVGADRSEAGVTLWLPAVASAADIELAWQTGMAMLSEAYPASRSYRVVVRTEDATLLSASAKGRDVRRAVERDDPAALRKAIAFTLLSDVPNPGELIPRNEGGSTQARQQELDAANRAAGLASTSGPAVNDAETLASAWEEAYANAPGVPAPTGGPQEAARFAAERIERALAAVSPSGAKALKEFVSDLVQQQDVALLREWAATTEAVASQHPLASVLALTAAATREVAGTVGGQDGNGGGALASGAVADFERVPALDASGSIDATGIVPATLARYGATREGLASLAWRTSEASPTEYAGAPTWKAFRGPDGALYWVPGDGAAVALMDASLRGWGYVVPSAVLVDARDASRILQQYALGGTR